MTKLLSYTDFELDDIISLDEIINERIDSEAVFLLRQLQNTYIF